jgi:hypothetical protein
MVKAIREAGREPVQRNTFYEPLANGQQPATAGDNNSSGKSKVLTENLAAG